MARPNPTLDLAALLAAEAFDEEDLTHNRRGALSSRQEAWRAAHPRFMDDEEGGDGAVEALVGRVAIEGRYAAGHMGQTTFAKLALPGRRLSLYPALARRLVRDAPYRAYAAYGWIWSIEPITEDELHAATSAIPTYRSSSQHADTASIARALEEALSTELSFSPADLAANTRGRFSPAQRALGRKKLVFATARLLISSAALWGFAAVLDSGAPFPVLATFAALAGLAVFWITSVRSVVGALARLVHPRPLCAIARLDSDPTNRDNLVLENEGRPWKVKRAALTIPEAPFATLRAWRFEVHFVPWTRSVVAVRPVAPSDSEGER